MTEAEEEEKGKDERYSQEKKRTAPDDKYETNHEERGCHEPITFFFSVYSVLGHNLVRLAWFGTIINCWAFLFGLMEEEGGRKRRGRGITMGKNERKEESDRENGDTEDPNPYHLFGTIIDYIKLLLSRDGKA